MPVRGDPDKQEVFANAETQRPDSTAKVLFERLRERHPNAPAELFVAFLNDTNGRTAAGAIDEMARIYAFEHDEDRLAETEADFTLRSGTSPHVA